MSESHGTAAQPAPLFNIANILTMVRIVMVPIFVWLMVADHQTHGWWRWAALLVFVLAIYTDKLDGDLARSRNLITNFGKIADPIADKLLIGSALILLSVFGELNWAITVVILVREIGITVLRFAVIRVGVIPASRGGKLKTVLQTVAILVYLLPITPQFWFVSLVALIIMLAALVVTVVTGVDYIVQAIRMAKGRSRQ